MSEFRQDPVSGQWVIVAPERAARPTDFPVVRRQRKGGFCPFCEGNESRTPPEITAIRAKGSLPNQPGWRTRVVPNRFPALQMTAKTSVDMDGVLGRRMVGFGTHEVIVECPEHLSSTSEMTPAAVRDVLLTYQQRLLALRCDSRLAYAVIFKNVGAAAGASLEHSHSQLVATPVVPRVMREELAGATRFAEDKGDCVFCSMIVGESTSGERLVHMTKSFVTIAPYASRFPFETWILPRQHCASYEEQPPETFGELASAMCKLIREMDIALDSPAYNYIIHTAPFADKSATAYHWHIEVIPRTTRIAGFEWGTGFCINPVPPERAAQLLRSGSGGAQATMSDQEGSR